MKNIELSSLKILEQRRSCRTFTDEQIDKETIDKIIMAGQAAPIGMNRIKDIKIIIVQNKDLLNELEDNTWKVFSKENHRSSIYKAPTLVIVGVKKSEDYLMKGQYCSAACILENMIICATEMGLGTVYLSGVTTALNKNSKLLAKLSFPDDYVAASALAIGVSKNAMMKRDLHEDRIPVEWIN